MKAIDVVRIICFCVVLILNTISQQAEDDDLSKMLYSMAIGVTAAGAFVFDAYVL